MALKTPVRIGTRGSPLALAQAEEVAALLTAAHDLAPDQTAVTVISTTGDAIQDRPLSEIGGKGLFTKELELALDDGRIDIAVHSMKDVPTVLQPGHAIVAVLPREDVRDVFVSETYATISELPHGARLGSSSLRRRAQLLALRPDLKMVDFRGNVQTRLRKLRDGVAAASILAKAGLNRLGQSIGTVIDTSEMLPAIAQGAVGIEALASRRDLAEALQSLHDDTTAKRIGCERAFLRTLDGSCRTPIAGLAEIDGDGMAFRGEVLAPDGSRVLRVSRQSATGAYDMGIDAAKELIGQGAKSLF